MKKTILFIFLLILIVPITFAGGGDYMDYVTIGQGDLRWCKLNGVCTLDTITVESIITGNLSVIGEVFNVTMNLVTWNITESFNVGGDLTANAIDASGNITINTGVNANPTLKYREGGIDNGFDIMTKLFATNYLEFNAIDGGVSTTRFKIRRLAPEIESYSNMDFQNDYNITNLNCIELDNKEICSWDSVNVSIGDVNISEGTGEHWVNESGDTMTGDLNMGGYNITNTNLNHSLQDAYDDQSSPLLEPHINATDSLWFTFPTDANGFIIDLVDTATYTDFLVRYGGVTGDDYDGFEIANHVCVPPGLADCVDSHILIVRSPKWLPYADNTYDLGGTDHQGNLYRWRDLYLAGTIKGTGSNESLYINASSGDVRFGFENFNVTNNGSVATSKDMIVGTNFTVDTNTLFVDSTNNRVGIGQTEGFDPVMGLSVTGDIDITHTSTEANDHAFEIIIDAAGFGDVKGVDIVYETGAIVTGEDEEVILIGIDESQALGGDVVAVEVLATEGLATIYGLEAGALVNPVIQLSGTFMDMDSANNSGADNLSNFISSADDHPIFVSDDDYIIIGDAAKFEEIEFLLNTTASNPGIKPTLEFSTGVDTWTEFFPADGTEGMRHTAVIAWLDEDIPDWAVGTGNEYLIRITRTQNNLNTIPIEDKVQIAAVTVYRWDKNGDLLIKDVNATNAIIDNDIYLNDKLYHKGDTDTYIDFGTDQTAFRAGNIEFMKYFKAGPFQSITINEGGEEVYFRIESDNDISAFYVHGGNGNIGIGTQNPNTKLEVEGNVHITGLEGTYTGGNATVCVYNNGTLYASDGGCG